MPRMLLLALSLVLLAAGPADAATYKATFSGTQELTWKVDGVTTNQCESRRGSGGGTVKFTVKSDRSALLTSTSASKLSLLGSIPSTAKGSITGRFSDTIAAPCGDAPPGDPITEKTTGCGATKFGIRIDFKPVGAFTYFTGPGTPLQTGSIATAAGVDNDRCPWITDLSIISSNDYSRCGDGQAFHKRSWGVAQSGGEGLFASKIAKTKALKKGAKRNLTGRTVVDCTVDSIYGGGVKLEGELKYTLAIKRTS